jgi:predicted nucleotidyltransferase
LQERQVVVSVHRDKLDLVADGLHDFRAVKQELADRAIPELPDLLLGDDAVVADLLPFDGVELGGDAVVGRQDEALFEVDECARAALVDDEVGLVDRPVHVVERPLLRLTDRRHGHHEQQDSGEQLTHRTSP